MRQILLVVLTAAIFGSYVALAGTTAPAASTSTLNPAGPVLPKADKFVVHEWGTFTSVQGSDGNIIGGLHHEEEPLPSFVVGRDILTELTASQLLVSQFRNLGGFGGQGNCRPVKFMPVCDDYDEPQQPTPVPTPTPILKQVVTGADVTQKMETPVLYFYSDKKRQVKINVGFPQGIISQYFPAPINFTPLIGKIQGLHGGSTQFDVEVVTEKLPLPAVETGNVYGPAREVASNDIRSGNQNERFIFYRGLGNFVTDLRVTSKSTNELTLSHKSVQGRISEIFLVNVTESGGNIISLGGLSPLEEKVVSAKDLNLFLKNDYPVYYFNKVAQQEITRALVESGLYKDESLAMFNTWKTSYLKTRGLRILYVLSRNETDRLLPLTIDPQPQEVVRTLVGRIELILKSEEEQMLLNLSANSTLNPAELGRFAEPRLRRLKNLVPFGRDKNTIDGLIRQLN